MQSRYARMPMFGRAKICQFKENMSAMKRFAARDFEQALKVCDVTSSSSDLQMLTFA